MTASDAEAELWKFALAVYGSDGVAEDCLHLQERYGADVPVLLCALWMAGRGIVLKAPAMQALARTVDAWHADIVKPLRAVRQRMKHGPAPAPNTRTETLRGALKSVELNAERIEMAVLAEHVAATAQVGEAVDCRANLRTALSHFAGRPIDDLSGASALIAACEAQTGR